MKITELRGLSQDERTKALKEAQNELLVERGVASMGGAPRNPGRIRALRTTIARILTLDTEERKRA